LKVCFDAQPIVGKRTGIGKYVYGLLKAYSQMPLELDISAFYFNAKKTFKEYSLFDRNKRLTNKEIKCLPGSYSFYVWPYFPYPKVEDLIGKHDVYHCTHSIGLPIKSGKSLITVYDLTYKRFPEYIEKENKKRLDKQFDNVINNAAGIITISEFSKNEIIDVYNIPKDKVHAIHLGLDFEEENYSEKINIKDVLGFSDPYILNVSTIEPRKNNLLLIKAFNFLAKSDKKLNLVLIGNKGWKCDDTLYEIECSPYRSRIHVLGYLSDTAVKTIYKNASVFVFPSIYEGFGFPPLEAMQHNTPVISSNAASLGEVLKDAAMLFDPKETSPLDLSEMIAAVINSEELRNSLILKGKKVVKHYNWQRTADQTLAVYKK